MAAYADSDDMIARFDERTLKELTSDGNTPTVSLAASGALTAAMADATGAIDAALFVGNQYQPGDLDDLTGESQSYLKRITCTIAMSYLVARRPEKYGKASKQMSEDVQELLELFRSGVRVFDVDGNKAAGTPTIDGPRAVDYERMNMIRDRTRHFYPSRASSLQIGR